MKKQVFLHYLSEDRFEDLFIELGWDDYGDSEPLYETEIDGKQYDFYVAADRKGFKVLKCAVDDTPTTALYKKLDSQIRKSAHDYICIYYIPKKMKQMWIVPVDKVDKRDLVSVKYADEAHAEFLYEKIEDFTFPLGVETNIIDVKKRVQKAFIVNSEKLTKKFYDEFKKQHKLFEGFIEGIPNDTDRRWYASIMLDRLMFCYFIQKKGFLDNKTDYLQYKLKEVRKHEGENEFFAFYKDFLCQLFHDGLNTPHHDTNVFRKKFGRIPYLNGGMFDVHLLEHRYPDIQIKDDAFANLFNFFDQWEWHLDTRMSASGKDINPDVLGYIFERFINDRAQMGAYYTQEDITGYIGRNCILPFLFDKMKAKMPKFFEKGGKVWKFLQQSGSTYIYEAVKKGYSADWRERIPEDIAIGLDTSKPDLLERRKHWNEKTSEEFALPTEIWRETIERLQRCENILKKIKNGEINDINDFITYNLNIRLFAYDVLEQTDDHNFIRHFYHALQRITILDPTCGSGAFLFAAMNILEPLYEVCIMRMEEFNKENANLFKDELAEISNKYRSNIQYFIFKSIILRNLYGVDIMAEAIEIAKLRLFLKMVAVVDVDLKAENMGLDPLPDIDFNIRCGNTLVGYATEKQLEKSLSYGDMWAMLDFKDKIQNKLDIISKTYETFKWLQINQQDDRDAFNVAKKQLNDKLASLNEDLNQHMYGHKPDLGYNPWLKRTQPFHWIAEFYGIMHNGGFDIIIGNPPYVEYNKKDAKTHIAISDLYKVEGYKTESCCNLYAYVMERCKYLINANGYISMIVPLSGHSTERMAPLVKEFYNKFNFHTHLNLSADANPSRLFEGVKFRLSIFIASNAGQGCYTTQYRRWYAEEREVLFDALIRYNDIQDFSYQNIIPKIADAKEISIFKKVLKDKPFFIGVGSKSCLYHNAPVNWIRAQSFVPYFKSEREGESITTQLKKLKFVSVEESKVAMDIIDSSLFFLWWIANSDCYHLNKPEIENFRFTMEKDEEDLVRLSDKLSNDMKAKSKRRVYNYKTTGRVEYDEFYMKKSKPIIDEIDKVLAKHYGFTDEELDFIINYDIKYRMGDELGNE